MDASPISQNAVQLPQIIYSDRKYAREFQNERDVLLQLAFKGEKQVTVEKRLSGYSGAQTWRVSIPETERKEAQIFVVKLAHPVILAREYENYRNRVAGVLSNTAQLMDAPLSSTNGEWALLKYTFVGNQSRTLLEYLPDNRSVDVTTLLSDIDRSMSPWWKYSRNQRIKCSVYYDRLLPPHLHLDAFSGTVDDPQQLRASEIEDDMADLDREINNGDRPNIYMQDFQVEKVKNDILTVSADPPTNVQSPKIRLKVEKVNRIKLEKVQEWTPGSHISLYTNNPRTRRDLLNDYAQKVLPEFGGGVKTFTIDNIRYPNPILYLQKLLDEIYTAKIATIHGDFNLQNILIESDERTKSYKQHRLIDFAETGKGPVLLDLQWLESQVITWLLAPAIEEAGYNVNVLIDVFKALHEFNDLPSELRATLQTPYTVLLGIRRLVQDHYLAAPNQWEEYYRGLVIALLGTLRFEELGKYARKIAFLSAAALIRWTRVLDEDLPTRVFGSPSPPPQHTLNYTKLGNGTIIVNPPQSAYPLGTTVSLSAKPDPGWQFSGWSGDSSGNVNPLSLVMDGDKMITANFVPTVQPPTNLAGKQRDDYELVKKGEHKTGQWRPLLWLGGATVTLVMIFLAVLRLGQLPTAVNPVAACDPQLPTIKIGIAINGSGRYLIFGQDQIIGYQLGFKYTNERSGINDRCIELVYKDLESSIDPIKLKTDIQDLVNANVVAIIAPGLSQQVAMISDTLRLITTPVIGPSTTKLDLICGNDYFSRISAPGAWYNDQAITEAANVLRKNGNNNKLKIVVAYATDDAFTQAESEKFIELIKERPDEFELVSGEYNYQTQASDSDNQLKVLAKTIIEVQPDIIIISGLTNDGRNLIKALRTSAPDQAGFTGPIIGGNGLNTPYIFDNCMECNNLFIPQAYSHMSDSPINGNFLEMYQSYDEEYNGEYGAKIDKPKHDSNPGQFTAQMFTAVQLIVESLRSPEVQKILEQKNINSMETDELTLLRQQLNKSLLSRTSTAPFDTLLGPLWLNHEGEVMQSRFYVANSEQNTDGSGYHFKISDPFTVKPEVEAAKECKTP